MTSAPDIQARTWCVIPAYNNAATVRHVAAGCREQLDNVLVVDDGSEDADLRELLADLDVRVVRHPRNRGKGAALTTALEHLSRVGARFMITIDADGQHFPADIARLLPALDQDAVIIGAREEVVGQMPARSRFGRRFSNLWVLAETAEALSDTQSGFRAYPVAHLRELPLRCRRYDWEVEVLARAAWAGLELRSVPVRVRYPAAAQRHSSFRPVVDNARIALTHARLIGRKLLPWPARRLVARPCSTMELLRRPRKLLGRLLRENSTPAGLALSAGVGMFLGALPLIGLHIVTILYATVRLRLNKFMALSIQNLCMPPFVPGTCIAVGYFLRHRRAITTASLRHLAQHPLERAWEWGLGSLIVAPLLALISALLVYVLASWVQRRARGSRADWRSKERTADLEQRP